jgi:integrase
MTDLRSTLERYVNMRRGLGYKFQRQAQRLADFVSFMEKRKAVTITTKLAVKWATLSPDCHASWALKLAAVRGFARHVASLNPKTEVPPPGILPPLKRPKPYVYTNVEINALLAAALALPPTDGLRRWTYHCLFGLLAVTGLRLSEVIFRGAGPRRPDPAGPCDTEQAPRQAPSAFPDAPRDRGDTCRT